MTASKLQNKTLVKYTILTQLLGHSLLMNKFDYFYCHVRIEKGPVQTVAIILEAHNFLEYHYML